VLVKEQAGGLVYGLYASSDTGRPAGIVHLGGEVDVRGSAPLTPNVWSHLALTYDGAVLRLYVNGVLSGSRSASGALPVSAGALRIGGNALWGEHFAGRIDEVRLWHRALSQAELQGEMAAEADKIALHAGWNWFSFSLGTASPVAGVLGSIAGQYDYVLGEEGTHAPSPPLAPLSTLHRLEPGRGYLVRMTRAAELSLRGVRVAESTPMALSTGWHWIGYLAGTARDLPEALDSLGGRYDLVLGETGTYSAVLPAYLNTLSQLEPGRSYHVRMTAAGTLVYGSGVVGLSAPAEESSAARPGPTKASAAVLPSLTATPMPSGTPVPSATVSPSGTPKATPGEKARPKGTRQASATPTPTPGAGPGATLP
jgi:hypothetical protein